jgi:phosphoribosylanthranilate isomerase
MKRFQIKVCGITRVADAQLVAELGGDMIGLIFYPGSRRRVTVKNARDISRLAPPTLDRVGVFVDADIDTILRTAEKVRLDVIQLHGNARIRDMRRLQSEGYRIIKAFPVVSRNIFRLMQSSRADFVMLDNSVPDAPGGTGKPFDWSIRPKTDIPNLILAGGLTSTNVSRGVRVFNPLVVDVNSGVEKSPGVKSSIKLKRFFKVCDKLRYGTR